MRPSQRRFPPFLLIGASLALAACAMQPTSSPANDATGVNSNAGAQGASAYPIPDIGYTEFKLANGLTVIVHADHSAPIVAVNTWYHVGSKNEPPGRFGFAHLFEHLMFNGSEHYNDEFFIPFDRVGATDQNGTTNRDRTNYFETLPSTALDLALWMESDRMGWLLPAVDQKTLETQRGVVKNEKRQGANQPYGEVFKHIAHATYPVGHPYHHTVIGTLEDLNAATLADVRDWFQAYYGPNNAVLSIAGDVDTQTVREKVKKFYGDISASPPVGHMQEWTAKTYGAGHEVLQDRVPAARVYMVWNVPALTAPATHYLEVVARILAGGKASRLYKRLVYTDQIASNVNAFVYTGEIASQFMIIATATPGGSLGKVKSAIREELARFLAEGPTQAELERAKAGLYSDFVRGLERIGGFGGISAILARGEVYYATPSAYKTVLKRQLAASTEELKRVANNWLGSEAYVLDVLPYGEFSTAGGGADRSALPQVGSFPEIDFPDLETATLDNGLRLVVAHHGDLPLVHFSLQFDAGYAADAYAVPGTAKLAMEALTAGTTTRGALAISKRLHRLGASLSTGSSLDTSFVDMAALKANLGESLALFADVILHPTYPAENVAKLRKQQIAKIRQEMHRPIAIGLRLMPELLYGDEHAYSMPLTGSGYIETVSRLEPSDLERFHEAWFEPNNATLIVVGGTSMEEIRPTIEKLFADWQSGEVPEKHVAHVSPPSETDVYLVDRPGSEQSIILAATLAPPYGADNHMAIVMMNQIFGGTFNSRVNIYLREKKHWAYGAGSLLLPARGQEPFLIYAPVQADKTAESMAAIHELAAAYLTGKPATREELARVTAERVHGMAGRWETNSAVSESINTLVAFDLPQRYWDSYPRRVRGVDVGEVRQAAEEVITPGKLVWIVIGDLERVGDAVRRLDLGEIHYINARGEPVAPPAQ